MLSELLSRVAATDPGKAAVVQGGRRVRYDELDALVGRAAGGLQRLGIRPGDCVAVALPNGPEFVALLFACARLQAVLLPLNPRDRPEALARFAADARARVVVADPPAADAFAALDATRVPPQSLLRDVEAGRPATRFGGRALYLYTSGSTDTAKRLCFTQENLVYEARNFVETVGLSAADNVLCTIPLHHSYGLGNCLLDAVYVGSTLVLAEADDAPFVARAERVLATVRDEGVRFYPGTPYQFQLLAALPRRPGHDLAAVRLCVSSGDALPRSTYQRFRERFGLSIRSLYGSTEAGSIAIDPAPDETFRFGSLGPALKNVYVRIRDDAGRDLPADEVGQVWVSSPAVPPTGYENRPELTATVFQGGYCNTGDLGKLDARGYLILTGRKQSFVDVGGHKVDVGETEEVLHGHPRVREAAVLGVDVPGVGTVLKAVVVAADGCDEAAVLAYCRERLAAFKVPRLVEFRDALPRSPLGKVLKSELGGAPDYLAAVRRTNLGPALPAGDADRRAGQTEVLAEQVREQAALALQCAPAALSRSAPFRGMGFDSLRAAELHARLEKLTGLPLPVTTLWNYPSIDRLAAALWSRLHAGPGAGPPPTGEAAATAADLAGLLGDVDRLSDAEVDAHFRAK